MKIELTKDDLRVANAASDEGIRLNLEQVHIRENEIYAADGFMLVRREVETGKLEEPEPGKIGGARHFPASIAKVIKNGKITLELGVEIARFSNSDYTIEAQLPKITFDLDIDGLYKIGEAKAVTALSIPILRKLLKALP